MPLLGHRLAVVAVCAAATTSCAASRVAERPTRCPFEPVLASWAVEKPPSCGSAVENAPCGSACADRVRACVLGAVASRQAFSAVWSPSSYDGVALRDAIVARARPDGGYEIRWLHHSYAARCGAPGDCVDAVHEAWTARVCEGLVELDATCASEGVEGPSECGLGERQRIDVLGLGCVRPALAASCAD